jgi:hypothetical protein
MTCRTLNIAGGLSLTTSADVKRFLNKQVTQMNKTKAMGDFGMIKMNKIIFLLMFSVTVLFEQLAIAGVHQDVKFSRGTSGTVIEQSVIRGERDVYALVAGAGQYLSVHISAIENNAVFDLYTPGTKENPDNEFVGKMLPGATESRSFIGQLPAAGKYLIVVGGTRGNASYTLNISVTNSPPLQLVSSTSIATEKTTVIKSSPAASKPQAVIPVVEVASKTPTFVKDASTAALVGQWKCETGALLKAHTGEIISFDTRHPLSLGNQILALTFNDNGRAEGRFDDKSGWFGTWNGTTFVTDAGKTYKIQLINANHFYGIAGRGFGVNEGIVYGLSNSCRR